MKNVFKLIFIALVLTSEAFSQVAINSDGSQADPSSILDVKSNSKGLLIPRMTLNQRDSIQNPANGLIIICTDCGIEVLNIFLNGFWQSFAMQSCNPSNPTEGIHYVTESQIIWKWDSVPMAIGYKWNTTNNYQTSTDVGNAISFSENGLSCSTSYTRYIWAYTGCGSSNVTMLSKSTAPCWVCGNDIIDSRDGKNYSTILIGTQCWLGENLNIGTRIDVLNMQTNNAIIEKYCYNDNDANCTEYGGLYQWKETMLYSTSSNSNPSGRKGICLDGWHIPSEAEFLQLVELFGGESQAGGALKEVGFSHWIEPNSGASNLSGLTTLPGGRSMISSEYLFLRLQLSGYLWTATQYNSVTAFNLCLSYDYSEAPMCFNEKTNGYSVRCIKD